MKKLFVILLLSLPAFSQGLGNLSLKHFQGVPTGSCSKNTLGENDLTGFLYSCDVSQSPPQWTTNTVSGICTGVGNCLISGNLFVGPGTPNEGTTGTDLNLTAEFVNVAGVVKLKKCAAAKQYCFTVVRESAGGTVGVTTGNAWVNGAFTETDTFTNTAVVGNWFKATAAGTAGQVDDTGTANTSACPSGSTCLGFAVTGGTGAQTVVRLSPVVGGAAGGTVNGVITGACTGAVAAGTTRALFPLGASSSACSTSFASANPQWRAPASLTLTRMDCTAATAGVGAGSGVTTINKNGSASALTCTIGTGTSCTFSSNVALVAGDLVGATTAGITSETLATVGCNISYTIP